MRQVEAHGETVREVVSHGYDKSLRELEMAQECL